MNSILTVLTLTVPLALIGCGVPVDDSTEDTGTTEEAVVLIEEVDSGPIEEEEVDIPKWILVNVAAGKTVAANGPVSGVLSHLTDTVFAEDGAPWDHPDYAIVTEPGSSLIIDIGRVYPVSRLVMQGDWNDFYRVDASSDGATWQHVHDFPPDNDGWGLQTRPAVELSAPVQARYLRVHGISGDVWRSVSELQAFAFGEECNGNLCTDSSFCCNYSCGICAPKDGGCTQQYCSSLP